MNKRLISSGNREQRKLTRGWGRRMIVRRGLKSRSPRKVETSRVNACTIENLSPHFERLRSLYQRHKYSPDLIYNVDESMVEGSTGNYRVIVHSDDIVPTTEIPDQIRLHITIVTCVSAAGFAMPNLLILPRKEFPASLQSFAREFVWAGTEGGWMTQTIFEEWIEKVFIPNANKTRHEIQSDSTTRPRILLITDSHSSRRSSIAIRLLMQQAVDLITLPSHSSHLTQPLIRGVFRIFKSAMEKNLSETVPYSQCPMENVVLCVQDAMQQATTRLRIMEAFEVAGVWPLNPEKIFLSCKVRGLGCDETPTRKKPRRSFVKIDNALLTSDEMVLALEHQKKRVVKSRK